MIFKNIRIIWILALLALMCSCTNYSSDSQIVNSPILLDIAVEDTGHIITVAAQNMELGFLGYRLYAGRDESAVRSTPVASGLDCGAFSTQPNTPVEYVLEVKPNQTTVSPGHSNRVCAFNASLQSGNYIGIRSLIFSVTTVNTSEMSNVLRIP